MTPILIYVTAASEQEAQKIADALVAEHLAACVTMLPGLTSTYSWQGKVERSTEVGLTIKSSQELWPMVGERIREIHSYTCPEIVAIAAVEVDPDYLKWWQENLE